MSAPLPTTTPAPQGRDAPLKQLDVGNNSLGVASAEPFARLVRGKASSLVELNLYMNETGDAGVVALCPALKDCK